MIDWDEKTIEQIDLHYRKILSPSINFKYFCRYFEQIYPIITDNDEILPDILNDITFYTLNGINAKDKIITPLPTKDKEEKIYNKIKKQKNHRHMAMTRGISEYYQFIQDELDEFVKKHPYWKEIQIKGGKK